MPVRPIHFATLAAALLASPVLAEDYPLPAMSASAYSETSYEAGWEGGSSWESEGSWEGEGEVIYMDELEDGEEWRSGDYEEYEDYGDYDDERRVRTVVRHEPGPMPPPRTGEPAWGGDRPLSYGEGERHAWLAECRSRMSQGREYGVDACADYLARYESGAGGYDYSYGYGQTASQGCGCGCGGGCGGGCNKGGCGCTVSYRFAPMPAMPVAQRAQAKTRRIITTEEWEEEIPGKTVRVIPAPPRQVRTKLVPVAPAPVKTVKQRYVK